jgi:hypothetical protein
LKKINYVKVDNILYKINTDFRVAIECNNIARDKKIGDYERALAIIYKLFGEEGLKCTRMEKLLNLGMRYISIYPDEKKGLNNDLDSKFNLDFEKCKGLIESSFKFDYKYNPYEMEYLHWYDFYNDLQNLSTSEFGTCCILNRVAGILNTEASEIKDTKQRTKLVQMQENLKRKYCYVEEKEMTKEQEESARNFYKELGIEI